MLSLSSLHPSPSPPSSPILPALPKSAQVQLERQNRKIAKVAQKLQEKQDREKVAEQRGDRRNPRRADKRKDAEANLARIQAYYSKTVYIPTTWEDAMTCPDSHLWQAAWQSELQSILDRGTFSKPIKIPDGQNTITAKVVWDVKYAEDGSVARYKARLVARGFTQVYGVDYEETFAPTIRYDALRIFLAIAAKNNWKVHQLDIVTAFLAGKLDEIIYLKVPHFLRDLLGDYVQILQSIYGLKQAARVWYLLLEEFLRSIGFLPLPSDPSVLTNGKVMISRVALAVYVDDLLIAGKNEEDILHVKQLLKQRFEVKDLGEVRIVLGIRVKRFGQCMTLDQSQYAAVILRQFLDETSLPYLIPMEPDAVHKLAATGGEILSENQKCRYLQAIGKLMHLCHIRPDIVFTVHKLAEFSSNPYLIHESTLQRVFGYVKYTIGFGI